MFTDATWQIPMGYQEPDVETLGSPGRETETSAGLLTLSVSFVFADSSWAPPMGKAGGEVKLSISYKNSKLFIMVMHIRGLVSARAAPT